MIGYTYCWQHDVTGHGPFQRMTTDYHKPLLTFTHILNPTSSTDRHTSAICLVDLTERTDTRRLVRCNHQFHITCLDTWCKVYMKMTCPYCRTDISHKINITHILGIIWSLLSDLCCLTSNCQKKKKDECTQLDDTNPVGRCSCLFTFGMMLHLL